MNLIVSPFPLTISLTMPFQFDVRRLFFTYSQSGETTKDELLQFLNGERFGPKFVLVARELHDDGQPHLHAVVDFGERRFRSRDERIFDINGLHPNWKAPRSDRQWHNQVNYCKKHGDFVEVGEYEEPEERGHKQQRWIDLIDGSENRDDFMAKAKTVAPRDFVLQNDKFEAFAAKYYNNVATYVSEYTPEDFEYIPTAAKDWVEEVLNQVCLRWLLVY